MSSCPYCFTDMPPWMMYTWACTSGQCPATPDRDASQFHGMEFRTGPQAWLRWSDGVQWPPPAPRCNTCQTPMTETCPSCRYSLLPAWRTAATTCVAMSGARTTGKSLYLAVLVKQLEQLGEQLNVIVGPANDATRDTYRDVYERPLYEERGIMAPTPRADTADSYQREPLIFDLGTWVGQRRYLVLRDVAGEDLEATAANERALSFFSRADGVTFMFDPLRVPEVRDQLHELLPVQMNLGGDPKTVLLNTMKLVAGSTPKLAVVLSKFDAMQLLSSVRGTEWARIMSNSGAAFLRDPSLSRRGYQEEDGQLLHEEVRSLLQKLNARSIVTAVENPGSGLPLQHRFFAVSSLGAAPSGEAIHRSGIAPFRCLDPIRWIMAGSGVLE